MTTDTGVYRADTDRRYDDALAVRHAVFVDEQGVPEELEVDDYEGEATHFVAYDDGEAVGAARLRPYDADAEAKTAKVERVAVRDSHRGQGWGRRLMDAVETAAADAGFERLLLHAQTPVEGFYDRRGYRTVGEEFEEAGIPHVTMVRAVDGDGDGDGKGDADSDDADADDG